jgi:hypothetical protein
MSCKRGLLVNGKHIKRSQIRVMKRRCARITSSYHDRRRHYFDPNSLAFRVRRQQLGIKEQTING